MMTLRAPILLILLGSLFSGYGCSRDQEQALSSIDVQSAEHRVEIRWRHLDFPVQLPGMIIRAEEAPGPDLKRRCSTLAREMSLYPRGFLNKVGINTIVLCSKLIMNEQGVSAITDLKNNTMYLDVVVSREEFQRSSVFHHEVFHFIDWSDDGQVLRDPGWNSLNQGFQYGQGGESMQSVTEDVITKPIPTGFLSWYSTSGIAEDKAEVFSYLISNRDLVSHHVEFDKIIAQKVFAIQRIVRVFDREFGDSIWNAKRWNRSGNQRQLRSF